MPQEIPPRLEFPVDVTEKEYIEASLIAARRIGSLRPTPVIVAAAAALCAVGLLAFSWFASPLLPIMLCVLGLLLAIAFSPWSRPTSASGPAGIIRPTKS